MEGDGACRLGFEPVDCVLMSFSDLEDDPAPHQEVVDISDGDDEVQMTVMPTVIAASPKKCRRTLTRAKSATQTQTVASASSSSLTSDPISALQAEIVEHGPPIWASRILNMVQSSRYLFWKYGWVAGQKQFGSTCAEH